ncbi:MAG: protein phosphatase 2C domain-containing protein [Thermodesulfobacteriota bacterium]
MKRLDGIIPWHNLYLSYCGISDLGRTRKENEDDFLVMEQHRLFGVADGMGGQVAGKLASQTTLEGVSRCMNYLADTGDTTIPYGLTADMLRQPLLSCIAQFANYLVHQKADGSSMGSTLVVGHFTEGRLDFANVGDSRLYLWRGGQLTQLTEDHSLVYELYRMGNISREEMRVHNLRNIITRAIGTHPQVEPGLGSSDVRPGDIFLFCSDGLTTMLETAEIAAVLASGANLAAINQTLVARANEAGGRDNITTLLIAAQGMM